MPAEPTGPSTPQPADRSSRASAATGRSSRASAATGSGSNWTTRAAGPAELAILAHPDQRTTWAPALHVRLHAPLVRRAAQSRLDVLAVQHSIIGARLSGGRWTVAPAPPIGTFDGNLAALCQRFDLEHEAPLRVALSADGFELALVSHHAALDGRALVAVARALVGAEAGVGRVWRTDDSGEAEADAGRREVASSASGASGLDASSGGKREMLRRLAQPADRVAPSAPGSVTAASGSVTAASGSVTEASGSVTEASGSVTGAPGSVTGDPASVSVTPAPGSVERAPASGAGGRKFERFGRSPRTIARDGNDEVDTFVSLEIAEGRRLRVAAVAAAAVAAVADWNASRDEPWRRVGLTIPVGGPDVIGNVSSHRRVDVRFGADIEAAVSAALGSAAPLDAGSPLAARLLAPVVDRFSDSLLVSNLGRIVLPGAASVDFYPQARGRSAVAIGAATVDGGARRLTLRARDLGEDDAGRLLALIAQQLPVG